MICFPFFIFQFKLNNIEKTFLWISYVDIFSNSGKSTYVPLKPPNYIEIDWNVKLRKRNDIRMWSLHIKKYRIYKKVNDIVKYWTNSEYNASADKKEQYNVYNEIQRL